MAKHVKKSFILEAHKLTLSPFMRIVRRPLFTVFFILPFLYSNAQNCTNWLNTANTGAIHDGLTIGDLDVIGNQLTVEATFNSTATTITTGYNAALVSKHSTPADCNFVLRTDMAQLSTQSNGLVSIINPCGIVANKTYHVAMVYDGTTLKFFCNGFLMVSAPQHGNMVTNDLLAFIGNKAGGITTEGTRGTINEVRIWNVARTQSQLQTYMNSPLPNPTSQTGLLAYYTFDNLLNKQGNTAWNGTLVGSASINATNPNCTFIADSCNTIPAVTACNNWLSTPSNPSYVGLGDLDVSGNQITVEANINSTAINAGGRLYAGDIVSKHTDPSNTNYLLRPNSAEITTTNGYFITPVICNINLNQTYHVAMVYDGATLKFYRDGFLMSQVAATGNLFQNNLNTRIGLLDAIVSQSEQFFGYINEVRIWNVARTQVQLRTYMNSSLPNPTTQNGLLAYYTFDNLQNKQGNSTWNGTLSGSASLNATNPNCSFVADSCNTLSTSVIASFTTPDTVCVNSPFQITNTTVGASSYYWNFCTANINQAPVGINMGNVGNLLVRPVYIDYVQDNGNYYGFSTNNFPGKLLRLDFGTSLLNTPNVTDLGTVNGSIPTTTEGIQIVKNNGKWFLEIVGGDETGGITPFLTTVQLGANINNNNPIGTNWGNIGNLSYPHDLYVFQDGDIWYGLTVNFYKNTITRFTFGNDLSQLPSATNLGNIGNLSGPTGIQAIKDDSNNWHVFVTNATSSTLSRLDFGNSLLNIPKGINFGNINNTFNICWDIYIIKYCSNIIGYVINPGTGTLVKLDFNGNLLGVPTATDFGKIGNLNFPHCLSKLFRVGPDVYSFITNVNNNSITRLQFPSCTNSSISSSTLQNPSAISYNTSGIYNINLTVDDGLPTQGSYCKQITVLALPVINALADTNICKGSAIQLKPTILNATFFQWSPANYLSNPNIANPIASPIISTQYVLTANNNGYCTIKDTIKIIVSNLDSVRFTSTPITCSNFNFAGLAYPTNTSISSWQWTFGDGGVGTTQNVAHNYAVAGNNTVKLFATDVSGCSDSISVNIQAVIVIADAGNDSTICHDAKLQLNGSETGGTTFAWTPAQYLNDSTLLNPTGNIVKNTKFYLSVKNAQGCAATDSVTIKVKTIPIFFVSANTSICTNASAQLIASGGNLYQWSPITGLSNPLINNPIASLTQTTTYAVLIKETTCNDTATLFTTASVLPNPTIIAFSANDIDCTIGQSQLKATGALQYVWSPASGLNNTTIYNPIAAPTTTTTYIAVGKDQHGCIDSSSVTVIVSQDNKSGYYMPNAFTPNGDGLNDCFGIKYWGQINILQFTIYDRYGKKLFSTENPSGCWDGTFNGQPQPAGNYIFYIKAMTVCGAAEKRGSVILIR